MFQNVKSSFEKTASAQIKSGACLLSGVQVLTDGTNVAKVMLYDSAVGMTNAMMTGAGLAIGSTVQNVSSIAFDFIISGTVYSKAAVAAGTAPGNDVVPQNKYGAVAFDIGADGTIDAIEATGNAAGYNTAALAVAGLPAVAADHARMGYVTAMKSDGAFTFGTTALNAANTTVAYTSVAATTFNKIFERSVVGASHGLDRVWNPPLMCSNGIHCSISGTGASAIVDAV